jgi:NAD+ kinase
VTDVERAKRLALVVHPTRQVEGALHTIGGWAAEHGVEVVQLADDGGGRPDVAPLGSLEPGDLVVAVGGDGTVLSALRAAAAGGASVLGVACGSLGALTTVSVDDLAGALERVGAGDWMARPLPALAIRAADGTEDWAVNDFVFLRRGAGQLLLDVAVDDEPYVRLAGDGLIVATPAGSSGYTMAAGGPLLAAHTPAFACTPLAMHGGSAPPLVVRADATLAIEVQPSHLGFDLEMDGHRRPIEGRSFRVTFQEDKVDLVTFSPSDQGLRRLRQRGLIADSPRVLARDQREARRG